MLESAKSRAAGVLRRVRRDPRLAQMPLHPSNLSSLTVGADPTDDLRHPPGDGSGADQAAAHADDRSDDTAPTASLDPKGGDMDSAPPQPVIDPAPTHAHDALFKIDRFTCDTPVLDMCGPTRVTFWASVLRRDPSAWPDFVEVLEVDPDGRVTRQVGRLRKHAKNHPVLAAYEGQVWINPTQERVMRYQVQATINGVRHLGQHPVHIVATRFPTREIPPASRGVIVDPGSGDRLIANELTVRFNADTPPDRVQEIVAFEGAEILRKLSPTQQLFHIQIPRGQTIPQLRQAAAAFKAYDQVEATEFNPHPQQPAPTPQDAPPPPPVE